MSLIKAAIIDKLSVERSGRRLGSGLVEVIATYLVDDVDVKDVNEVVLADLREVARDAWANGKEGALLPAIHVKAITKWLSLGDTTPSIMGSMMGDDDDEEDDEDKLFGAVGANSRLSTQLAKDKTEQGLSGVRLLCLSAAIELGRVPSVGEVVGALTFGSSPALSDLAKKQRKAGVATLSTILKDSSHLMLDLSGHFGGIVREYSERRQIQEASRVTQFWAETQSISPDEKCMAEYLREYFKKYPGRGLPEVLDVIVATRVERGKRKGTHSHSHSHSHN